MQTSAVVELPVPSSDVTAARPRVWTVFVAYGAVLVGAGIASAAIMFIAMLVRAIRDPALASDPAAARTFASAAFLTPGVFLPVLATTAAVQVVVALCGGGLSREGARSRLALGPSRLDVRGLAVAALGCIALASTFEAVVGALGVELTGSLAQMGRLIAGLSPGTLVLMLAVAGLAAPLAEELFFRGYLQTRLCRRWGTWPGILVTAALFGLLHWDWLHTPSAFLLGLFLGWLARRSGSIRPSIAAHAMNNLASVLATWTGVGTSSRGAHLALLASCLVVLAASVAWLRRRLAEPVQTVSAVAS